MTNATVNHQPKFSLGQTVMTQGALQAFQEAGESPVPYLSRHISGDYGEIPVEDWKENELSVREGFRIISAYRLTTGTKVWLITEADRSLTTFLLPDEY